MIDKTYPDFADKANIIDFISRGEITQITPLISLSDRAKLIILSGIDSFGCLYTLIQHFVDRIRIDSSQTSDDLELWKDRVYQLCRCTFPTPKDFVIKARNIINPSSNLYEKLYEQFLRIDDWRSFLERIALDGFQFKDEVISKKSQLLSPVFLDITKNITQMLNPVITLLNTKIEKREIEKKRIKAADEVLLLKQKNQQIEEQTKEIQIEAEKRQKEFNDQLEKKKQEVIQAQKELEIAIREAEAARKKGGGFFGSICKFQLSFKYNKK